MITKNIEERTLSDAVRNRYKIPMLDHIDLSGLHSSTLIRRYDQMTFWGVIAWSPTYLKEVFKFSLVNMGYWASVYFAAGVLGSFVSSWVSDNIFHGKRRPDDCHAASSGTIPCILILSQLPPVSASLRCLRFLPELDFSPTWVGDRFLRGLQMYSRLRYTARQWDSCRCSDILAGLFARFIMSRLIRTTPAGADYTYSLDFCRLLRLLLVYSAPLW